MYGRQEEGQDLAEFVLSNIENRELIDEGIEESVKAIKEVILHGIDSAMNKYN